MLKTFLSLCKLQSCRNEPLTVNGNSQLYENFSGAPFFPEAGFMREYFIFLGEQSLCQKQLEMLYFIFKIKKRKCELPYACERISL